MAAKIDSFNRHSVQYGLSIAELAELAVRRGEALFSSTGALVVNTGSRTGRSPTDRFIVRGASTDTTVHWGAINQPISETVFNQLWDRVQEHLEERETYLNELHVGAHPNLYLPIRVTTEYAWHAMFARAIFIEAEPFNPSELPVWEVMSAPEFVCSPDRDRTQSDATVMIDFDSKRVLLAGMKYAGEMKKAMFTVQNFLLPQEDVLPMHCSANVDARGEVALFFGLSGTGKTTLSSDPSCLLIGDDEHGWGTGTVFNLEGGCYAKCINLSQEKEPVIYDAIRFGSIIENVVVDPMTREPDYTDDRFTENTRACYSRSNIELKVPENRSGEPSVIVFLTCDVSGVLPPVSILSKEAAAYHFLSGYTAKVGSTEVGSKEPYSATFSACFGEAFFPRHPRVYARLLMDRIEAFGSSVYLVNTGWTGGGYGEGTRFDIPVTRSIIQAAREGNIDHSKTRYIEGLNLEIPTSLEGIDATLLDPRETWNDAAAYDRAASNLVEKFRSNFEKFDVGASIVQAGPQ